MPLGRFQDDADDTWAPTRPKRSVIPLLKKPQGDDSTCQSSSACEQEQQEHQQQPLYVNDDPSDASSSVSVVSSSSPSSSVSSILFALQGIQANGVELELPPPIALRLGTHQQSDDDRIFSPLRLPLQQEQQQQQVAEVNEKFSPLRRSLPELSPTQLPSLHPQRNSRQFRRSLPEIPLCSVNTDVAEEQSNKQSKKETKQKETPPNPPMDDSPTGTVSCTSKSSSDSLDSPSPLEITATTTETIAAPRPTKSDCRRAMRLSCPFSIDNKAFSMLRDYDSLSQMMGLHQVPRLTWEEMSIRRLLGQGSFATVYEAHIPKLAQKQEDETGEGSSVEFLTTSSPSGPLLFNLGISTCAVKSLNMERIKCQDDLIVAARDLVKEASMLANLQHENIISLLGVSAHNLSESFITPQSMGYFFVLDVLQGTLRDRYNTWFNKSKNNNAIKRISDLVSGKNRVHVPSIFDRLETIALGIAKGLEYLHSENILLRDLKPENVGFDRLTGCVKLFDLGLARPLQDHDPALAHEIVGTYRYMSPEMMEGNCQGIPTDVYSFGVMLWELCTLQRPFNKFTTISSLKNDVVCKGYRPDLSQVKGEKDVRQLIRKCWNQDPNRRPNNFTEIVVTIKHILGWVDKDELTNVLLQNSSKNHNNNDNNKSDEIRPILKRRSTSILKPKESFTLFHVEDNRATL